MADRLALIRSRHAEAGGGDADKTWLLAEVERLREVIRRHLSSHEMDTVYGTISWACQDDEMRAVLDEALNSGDGAYRP
jgi:hypothetical protein